MEYKKGEAKMNKMNKTIMPTEEQEQILLFKYAEIMSKKYPELNLLVASANGGLRNKVVAAKLKAQGVKKGFPDVILPVARHGYHSLAIELKRIKGGALSPEQKEWIIALNEQGWLAVVCYGFEDARKAICFYLGIDRR